jgi:alanine racemase
MVKANAYGHGDAKIAKLLESWEVPSLGVCLIEEGLLLRRLGLKIPILVFRGFDAKGAHALAEYNLIPVVSHVDQLHILIDMKKPVSLHLKFDTGMNRLGFPAEQAEAILKLIEQNPFLKVEGVLTHLYQSEDSLKPNSESHKQLQSFLPLVSVFEKFTDNFHVLNSGAVASKLELLKNKKTDSLLSLRNWGLRPGLLFYGYNPVEQSSFQFKPALTLKSHTSVVRKVKKGEGVSYNHTWIAPEDSTVAVVPIGYADGWHRILSNQAGVLWNGKRAPLVGNICMDYLMVNVTGHEVLSENEVVFLGESSFGSQISVFETAKLAKTIPWEVLTSLGERVPRLYL